MSLATNISKNIGKNISQNLSGKYRQKLLDHSEQSATNTLKTASKRAIQKIAEETDDLIGNKIASKITKISPQNNSETDLQTEEKSTKIPKNYSSNKTVFHHEAEDYEKTLRKSAYNVKLHCKPTNQNTNTTINCKRNIIWFNPLFSKTISTKVALYILNLLDKHFPKNDKFCSIFNGNNVKVS